MNKNVKVAKQLVKLAKNLIAETFGDPELDGYEIKEYSGHYVALWHDAIGKDPIDIFCIENAVDDDESSHHDWYKFFSEWSAHLPNLDYNYGITCRPEYTFDEVWAQGEKIFVIHKKSEPLPENISDILEGNEEDYSNEE